jgi:hypothetical protein
MAQGGHHHNGGIQGYDKHKINTRNPIFDGLLLKGDDLEDLREKMKRRKEEEEEDRVEGVKEVRLQVPN